MENEIGVMAAPKAATDEEIGAMPMIRIEGMDEPQGMGAFQSKARARAFDLAAAKRADDESEEAFAGMPTDELRSRLEYVRLESRARMMMDNADSFGDEEFGSVFRELNKRRFIADDRSLAAFDALDGEGKVTNRSRLADFLAFSDRLSAAKTADEQQSLLGDKFASPALKAWREAKDNGASVAYARRKLEEEGRSWGDVGASLLENAKRLFGVKPGDEDAAKREAETAKLEDGSLLGQARKVVGDEARMWRKVGASVANPEFEWLSDRRAVAEYEKKLLGDELRAEAAKVMPFLTKAQRDLVNVYAAGGEVAQGVFKLMKPEDREMMYSMCQAVRPAADLNWLSEMAARVGMGVRSAWRGARRADVGATDWIMNKGGEFLLGKSNLWSTPEEREAIRRDMLDDIHWAQSVHDLKLKDPEGFLDKALAGYADSASMQYSMLGGALARSWAKPLAGTRTGAALAVGGLALESYSALAMIGEQFDNMLMHGIEIDKAGPLAVCGGLVDTYVESMNLKDWFGKSLAPAEMKRVGVRAALRAALKMDGKEFMRVLRTNAKQAFKIAGSEVREELLQGMNQQGWCSLAEGKDALDAFTSSEAFQAGAEAFWEALPACTAFGVFGAANVTGSVARGANGAYAEHLQEVSRIVARKNGVGELDRKGEAAAWRLAQNEAARVAEATKGMTRRERNEWINAQEDLTLAEKQFYAEHCDMYAASVAQDGREWADAHLSGSIDEAMFAKAGWRFEHDEKGWVTGVTTANGERFDVDFRNREATLDDLSDADKAALVEAWNREAADGEKLGGVDDPRLADAARQVNGFYSNGKIVLFGARATGATLGHEATHGMIDALSKIAGRQARRTVKALAGHLGGRVEGGKLDVGADEAAANRVEDIVFAREVANMDVAPERVDVRALGKNLVTALRKAVGLGKGRVFLPVVRTAEGVEANPEEYLHDLVAESLAALAQREANEAARKKEVAEARARHKAEREEKRQRKIELRRAEAERKAAEAKAEAERVQAEIEAAKKAKDEELRRAAKEIHERNLKEAEAEALRKKAEDEFRERLAVLEDRRRAAQAVAEYEAWKKDEAHKEEVRAEQEKQMDEILAEIAAEEQKEIDAINARHDAEARLLAEEEAKVERAREAEAERQRKMSEKMLENRRNAVKTMPKFRVPKDADEATAKRITAAYGAAWRAKTGKTLTQEDVDALAEVYGLPPEALNIKQTKNGYRLVKEQLLSDESLARFSEGLERFYDDILSVEIEVPDVVVGSVEEAANAVPNEVWDPVSETFIEGRVVVDAANAKSFREQAGLKDEDAPTVTPAEIVKSREGAAVEEDAAPKDGEETIVEKMTERAPVEELPIDEVHNDDTRIPNFKEGANPETGVVEPLMGEPYDLVANPIVVMEFKDGKKVVVTGRHRLDLYRRAGRRTIAARVIREADGWTVKDAQAIDAMANIIDEKGTVKDYVRFFENVKPTRADAEAGGWLARQKGRDAYGIYEGATPDTRAAIDWEATGNDGLISVAQAATISQVAPRGAEKRNAALQRVLVARALKGVTGRKLAILGRTLVEEAKRIPADAGSGGGATQLDLFASAEDQSLLKAMERQAEYRSRRANEYYRIAQVLRTAMQKGGKLELNAAYAKELGIKKRSSREDLAKARDLAVEKQLYWENAVQLEDADKAEMDRALAEEGKAAKTKFSVGDMRATLDPEAWGDLSREVRVVGGGSPTWVYPKGTKVSANKPELERLAYADVERQENFEVDPDNGDRSLVIDGTRIRIAKSGLFHGADRRLEKIGNAIANIGSVLNSSVAVPNIEGDYHYRVAETNFGRPEFVLITLKRVGNADAVANLSRVYAVNVKAGSAAQGVIPTSSSRSNGDIVSNLRAAWQGAFLPGIEKHAATRFSISHLYTGSAADYEKPSLVHVGTGEGSQVYGWGLYASNVRGVADGYAARKTFDEEAPGALYYNGEFVNNTALARKDPYIKTVIQAAYGVATGHYTSIEDFFDKRVSLFKKMDLPPKSIEDLQRYYDRYVREKDMWSNRRNEYVYEQTFFTNRAPGDESHLLNWYEMDNLMPGNALHEQVKWIRRQAKKEGVKLPRDLGSYGSDVYETLVGALGSPKAASEFLARADIDGVKYPVDSYGGKGVKDGDKTGWNYVSFRDDNISVDHKWVNGETRFSMRVNPNLRREVVAAINTDRTKGEVVKGGKHVVFCSAPDLFALLGIPDGKVYTKAYTLRKIAKEHSLTAEQIASAPNYIERPAVVFDDNGDGYIFLTEATAPDEDGVNAPIMFYVRPDGHGNYVASAYARKTAAEAKYVNLVNAGKVLFIDKEKVARLPLRGEAQSSLITFSVSDLVKTPEDLSSFVTARIVSQNGVGAQGGESVRVEVEGDGIVEKVKRLARPAVVPGADAPRFSIGDRSAANVAKFYLAREIMENRGRMPDMRRAANVARSLGYGGSLAELVRSAQTEAAQQTQLLRYLASDPKTEKVLADAGLALRNERAVERARSAAIQFSREVGEAAEGTKRATERAVRRMKGEDYERMVVREGLDLDAILRAIRPEERAASKDGEKDEGDGAAETPAALTDADRALIAQKAAEAIANGAEAVARAKELVKAKADADAAKAKDGAKDAGGAADSDEDGEGDGADDAHEGAIAKAIRETVAKAGFTLDSPEAMVQLVKAITEKYVRDFPGEFANLDADDPWSSPLVRAKFAANLASFAQSVADAYAPSYARVRVASRAQMLNDQGLTTVRQIEEAGEALFRDLHADVIRQSRSALIRDIRKLVKPHAKHYAENELKKDRQVDAALGRYCKFAYRVMGYSAKKCEERAAQLEQELAGWAGVEDADRDRIREFADRKMELEMIDMFGNLRARMPAELADLRDFVEQTINESRWEAMQFGEKWEAARHEAAQKAAGGIVGDPKRGGVKPEAVETSGLYSLIGMLETKARQLTRWATGQAREDSLKAFGAVEEMIQGAEDRQFNYMQGEKAKFVDLCATVYGDHVKAGRALTAEIDRSLWDSLDRGGQKTAWTVGRVMQMYVSCVQSDYADNCAKWGRDAAYVRHLEDVLNALDPRHMDFVEGLRGIYREQGAALDEVMRRTTGTTLLTPNRLYMPVKMFRDDNIAQKARARAYSPFAPSLTPRVKNGLDFRQDVDIVDMWQERMADAAHTIGWADAGSMVQGVLQSDSVLRAIRDAHGDKVLGQWQRYVLDILAGAEQGKVDSSNWGVAAMRFCARLASRTWLALNPASWAKQLGAVPCFALSGDGDLRSVAKSVSFVALRPFEAAKVMRDLAGTAAFQARYGVAISQEMKYATSGEGQFRNWISRLMDWSMKGIMGFDKLGVYALAGVYHQKRCELETQGKGAEEASELASSWLMHIVDKTAQTTRAVNTTELQRAGGAWGILLQFKSAPAQQTQFEITAIQDALAHPEDAKRWKKAAVCVLVNHVIVPTINTAIESVVTCLTSWGAPDEEKRRRLVEMWIANIVSGSLGSVVFIGTVAEGVGSLLGKVASGGDVNMYDLRNSLGRQIPAAEMLNLWVNQGDKAIKALLEVGDGDIAEGVEDMAFALGAVVPGLSWISRKGKQALDSAREK